MFLRFTSLFWIFLISFSTLGNSDTLLLVEMKIVDGDSSILNKIEFHYDENHNEIYYDEKNYEDNFFSNRNRFYNNQNQLIKEIIFQDSVLTDSVKYEYSNGSLLRITKWACDLSDCAIWITRFNDFQKPEKIEFYYSRNGIRKRQTVQYLKYDLIGNQIEDVTYTVGQERFTFPPGAYGDTIDYSDSLVNRSLRKHDSENRIISVENFIINDIHTNSKFYSYDSKGRTQKIELWTESSNECNIEQEYIYFDDANYVKIYSYMYDSYELIYFDELDRKILEESYSSNVGLTQRIEYTYNSEGYLISEKEESLLEGNKSIRLTSYKYKKVKL